MGGSPWNVVDKYELAELLSHWYDGQTDPIYAISSSIGGNEQNLTRQIVVDALYNLRHDYRKLAKRHFKGMSREDAAELRYVTDMLQQVCDAMPDDGSEDYEHNGTPVPMSGYAYMLQDSKHGWKSARDDEWDTVVLDPSDGPFEFVGKRKIDGAACNVWKGPVSRLYYAQTVAATGGGVNPSCPKCGHYNAMLERWEQKRDGSYGWVHECRDCGYKVES